MKINNLSSELSNLIEEKERLQQDLYKNRALETEKGSYDKELQDQRTKIRERQKELDKKIMNYSNIEKCLNNGGKISKIDFELENSSILLPDFSGINTKNIIFEEDTILTDAAPPYIPIVDENNFRVKGYIFDSIKIAPDLYVLATQGFKANDLNNLILVSLDQMVLIQDYYFTVANAKETQAANERTQRNIDAYYRISLDKRINFFAKSVTYDSLYANLKKKVSKSEWENLSFEQKEKLYQPVKRYKGKRIAQPLTNIGSNYMWTSFHSMFEAFIDPTAKVVNRLAHPKAWAYWSEFRENMKYKLLDIRTQRLIESDTRKLALETSFGFANTDNILFDKYGILVKRQNGSKINPTEIEQIKDAYIKTCKTFGSTIGFAKNDNLKISHTGNVNVFASRAIGVFIPSMLTIASSNKYGSQCFETTLAHEIAHYIDYLLGKQLGKRFLSDNYESAAGQIASQFRKSMNEQSSSDYINSTHECFARALEQYFAIENFGDDAKMVFNQTNPIDSTSYFAEKNYCSRSKYTQIIKPLIVDFLKKYSTTFPPFNEQTKAFVMEKPTVNIKILKLKGLAAKAKYKLAMI